MLRKNIMTMKFLRTTFKSLSKDKSGNYALIAALLVPLLLASAGLAIDIANQMALKTRFQAASDSVSLAVATRIANGDLTIANAEEFGTRLLLAQMSNDHSRFSNLQIAPLVKITEVINGGVSTWDVNVGGTATQDTTPVTAFLNKKTTSAKVTSLARSGIEGIQGAFSMAFVVDVSGSMRRAMSNGERKIDVLKRVAEDLFIQFNEADVDNKYVRTGVSSFASELVKTSNMEWGTSAASVLIASSRAKGGTATTPSFEWAYNEFKPENIQETDAHKHMNGQKPERFIVFMTDGDNDSNTDNTKTKELCNKARDGGIKVYTIAIKAPKEAQELLEDCAFSAANYFEADTASELVDTFKSIGLSVIKSQTRLVK